MNYSFNSFGKLNSIDVRRYTLPVRNALQRTATAPARWYWRAPLDLAIVPGSAITRIVDARGVRAEIPSALAVNRVDGKMITWGERAHLMDGRSPADIAVLHPFERGLVAHFDAASGYLREALSSLRRMRRPRVAVAVPAHATTLERRALREAVMAAGARQVVLVDQCMAATLGALGALEPRRAQMMVFIGAGSCMSVVRMGADVIYSDHARAAGTDLDNAIIEYVRQEYDVLLGPATAARLKEALTDNLDETHDIGGRDLVTGMPTKLRLTSKEIQRAVEPALMALSRCVEHTLESISVEMLGDLRRDGIYLSGGGARLTGLARFLESRVGLPVKLADQPQHCVALGLQRMLADRRLLKVATVTDSGLPAAVAPTLERMPASRARLGTLAALFCAVSLAAGAQHLANSGIAWSDEFQHTAASWQASAQKMSGWFHWHGGAVAAQPAGIDANEAAMTAMLIERERQINLLSRQNRELSHLLRVAPLLPSSSVAAHVLLRDPSGWLSSLTIDAGKKNGLSPHMPVTSAHGVIGEIASVTPSSSVVRMITSPATIMACRVQNKGAAGVLYGNGDGTCDLRYLDPEAPIAVGDPIVTSGLDGRYPAGLKVGRIEQVLSNRDTLYRVARVRPSADFANTDAVLVLAGR
jgi:rod shape-determining protein MreB